MFTNLKRITGGVILQGLCLHLIRYWSEISIILPNFISCLKIYYEFKKRRRKTSDNDFSISIDGRGCIMGSIPVARRCLSTLKIKNEAKK
nr:MAG TPA: hypothetical protein [Caudoviricetes sp.]